MERAANTSGETMILRLCLRIGLLSPWTSFAVANDASRLSVNVYRHIFSQTCDINVHIPNINLMQELSPLFTQIGRWYGQEETMQPCSGLTPDFRGSSRRPSDAAREADRAVVELQLLVESGRIFTLEHNQYIDLICRAYSIEVQYLKSAWVAPVKSSPWVKSSPPSEYLFGKRYGEVDRTLTGIDALRWIHRNDYESYTQNQPAETKLTKTTFEDMRQLFLKYVSTQDILTLIMMQMTNDLGKSEDLKSLYHQRLPGDNAHQVNHDMMMYYVVRDVPDLVPSFQRLPEDEQELVGRLLCISAEFNPAQLVQSECPPEAMMILREQDWSMEYSESALDRKFLELILDLSGALGQIDHEGAMTMTEPVVRSFLHALEMSKAVARNTKTAREAYYEVLEHRLDLLRNVGWNDELNIRDSDIDFAKARLFCMGRVDSQRKAAFFNQVYNDLPAHIQEDLEWGLRIDHDIARQATYMPGMIANCNTDEQLAALFTYLSRVLFLRQADLDTVQESDDVLIVERDVFWTIGSIVKQQSFKDHPFDHINEDTAMPSLQVLKRSQNQRSGLIGDEWYRPSTKCEDPSPNFGNSDHEKFACHRPITTSTEEDVNQFYIHRSETTNTDTSLASPTQQHHKQQISYPH